MSLKILLLCFYTLFFNLLSFSQDIKGEIINFEKNINYQLNLYSSKDSSLIKSSIADSLGKFEFAPLKPMNYFVLITNDLGYKFQSEKIYIIDGNSKIDLGKIALSAKIEEIDEIKISAKKSFIVRKADKIIVSPDALISSTGTTALDLLEKIPGIFVDFQGNISLKGKSGVVIFIDNRPTYLSPEELVNLLRSMPSNTIETIELMSNPPAKYDASGNAGIININLKKQREKGLNGSLTISYGQGRYSRTNNSLNLNKLKFFKIFFLKR
jgi:hypothetical protein